MVSTVLLIAAILCFLLACFGVAPGGVAILPLGLALLAGALLFSRPWPWTRAL